MFIYMIIKSHKKTVLIEIIVNNLFSKINMNFIIHYKGQGIGLKFPFAKWELSKEIITEPVVKAISIG